MRRSARRLVGAAGCTRSGRPVATFRCDPRFHPLHGREFILLAHRHNGREDRASFIDDRGQLVSLPARWTDLPPPDPSMVVATGRSAFRTADLREQAHLLKGPRRAGGPTP
jgi:hypothetical protein